MPMTREEFLKRFQENASHLGNPGTYSILIADYVDSKLPSAIPPVKPKKLNEPLTYEELETQNERIIQSNSDLISENQKLKSENQRLATENGTLKIKLQAISRALAAN